MAFLLDVEFALSEGVPEFDSAVTGAGDDLTVIGGEGDGEDIGLVAKELTGGQSCVKVP